MTLKPLFCAVLAGALLTACDSIPSSSSSNTPILTPLVFAEPELTPPFYALNPFSYDAPPPFELALQRAAAAPVQSLIVGEGAQAITLNTNKLIIPKTNQSQRAMTFAVLAGDNQVDITEIDDFLQLLEGKARHYPTRFSKRHERKGFEARLKTVIQQLDEWAVPENASFDILIRAFKANVMARNLDMGPIHTTKSLSYAQRILRLNPNDAEANFWFGFSLSEGGGHREAITYLNKAMQAGVQEAYLSAVNNYLALQENKNAIQTLKNYMVVYPQEADVAQRLIQGIQTSGHWNIWEEPKK